MRQFPAVVRQLLLCSFVLSISRAIVSPLLVLTLVRQLQIASQTVGMLLGSMLLVATLAGLYAGYLVDRFNRRRVLQAALLLVSAGLALMPFSHRIPLAATALLCMELSLVLFGIGIKALLSDLLPVAERIKAFSLRYTLANVGYAIGPLLGSLLAGQQVSWAFWLAASLTMACLPLLRRVPDTLPSHPVEATTPPARPAFLDTLQVLRSDRVLVLFTLGSLMACIVQGRLFDYLSLYLLHRFSDAEVLRWMSVLLVCNSLTVVLLQYPLSSLLKPHTLLRWIMLSSFLLALGLAGCALSDTLWAWGFWMVIFTLGEILLVPAEFMYIDAIAPEAMRGSYYGAQNLSQLGSALSPVLAGLMLAHWPPGGLLVLMMILSLCGAGFVWLADRQGRAKPDAALVGNASWQETP